MVFQSPPTRTLVALYTYTRRDVAKHPILLPLHVWVKLADSTTADLSFILCKLSPIAQPLFLRGM